MTVVVFGTFALFYPALIFRQSQGPVLIFSPGGIRYSRYSDTTVPWPRVREIIELEVREYFVQLRIDPSFAATLPLRKTMQILKGVRQNFGWDGMVIAPLGLRISRQRLLEVVRGYRWRYGTGETSKQ